MDELIRRPGFRSPSVFPQDQMVPGLPGMHSSWPVTRGFNHSYDLLRRFLPRLAHDALQYGIVPDDIAMRYTYNSDDSVENFGYTGMTSNELYWAYQQLLDRIQTCSSDGQVTAYLNESLHSRLRGDERNFGFRGQQDHNRTRRTFRTLAEISRQTDSLRLGTILSDFFLSNRELLMGDDIDDIAVWSLAVYRAKMQSDIKRRCFRIFLRDRPEIISMLRMNPHHHAEELLWALEGVRNDFGRVNLQPRGRTLRRNGQRRYQSESWSPLGGEDMFRSYRSVEPGDIYRPPTAPGYRASDRDAYVMKSVDRMTEEAERLRRLFLR